MDRLPELSAEGLIEHTRGQFEQLMREVAAAVNAAPEGRVINGSEEQVRALLGEFRRGVYQTALQMRVDAAQSRFFPRWTPRPAGASRTRAATRTIC